MDETLLNMLKLAFPVYGSHPAPPKTSSELSTPLPLTAVPRPNLHRPCSADALFGHIPEAQTPVGFSKPKRCLLSNTSIDLAALQNICSQISNIDQCSFQNQVKTWQTFCPGSHYSKDRSVFIKVFEYKQGVMVLRSFCPPAVIWSPPYIADMAGNPAG